VGGWHTSDGVKLGLLNRGNPPIGHHEYASHEAILTVPHHAVFLKIVKNVFRFQVEVYDPIFLVGILKATKNIVKDMECVWKAGPVRAWYVFQSYSAGGEERNRALAAADGE